MEPARWPAPARVITLVSPIEEAACQGLRTAGRFMFTGNDPRCDRLAKTARLALASAFLTFASALTLGSCVSTPSKATHSVVEHGKYLATIGVCAACHTPPAVPEAGELTFAQEQLRSEPDWFRYLDSSRPYAGGVPFIIRLSGQSHGVVYSRNISSDVKTGIGSWTKQQIVDALRTGRRPDGTNLFLFAPHTFFKHLSEEDADAIATYLKSLPPVSNEVRPRQLPFEPGPATEVPTVQARSPGGANLARAEYLTKSLVGCRECHSYTVNHEEHPWVGGDRRDPYNGSFRLGPDLPLRQQERGFAAFPYPGYAILFGGNLTRFGRGGDQEDVSRARLERAIRDGIAVNPDRYGRPLPLSHVMMWQFYRHMSDNDVKAISLYLKQLNYIEHDVGDRLVYFGDDWEKAFEFIFGERPTPADRQAFGK